MIKSINALTNRIETQNASRAEFVAASYACTDFMFKTLEERGLAIDGWDEFLFQYAQMKEDAFISTRGSIQKMEAYTAIMLRVSRGAFDRILEKLAYLSFFPEKKRNARFMTLNFLLHDIVEMLQEAPVSKTKISETEFYIAQLAAQHFKEIKQ